MKQILPSLDLVVARIGSGPTNWEEQGLMNSTAAAIISGERASAASGARRGGGVGMITNGTSRSGIGCIRVIRPIRGIRVDPDPEKEA